MPTEQDQIITSNLNNQKILTLKQFHKRIIKERFINNQASVYYSSQNSKFVKIFML